MKFKSILLLLFMFITILFAQAVPKNVYKLKDAIKEADVGKVEKYLKKKTDPNASDPSQGGAYRLINYTVDRLFENSSKENEYFEILTLFCEYNVNINGPEFPPIIKAVSKKHVKLVRFLIENGANFYVTDVDPFTGDKKTPFSIAFNNNSAEIMLILLLYIYKDIGIMRHFQNTIKSRPFINS